MRKKGLNSLKKSQIQKICRQRKEWSLAVMPGGKTGLSCHSCKLKKCLIIPLDLKKNPVTGVRFQNSIQVWKGLLPNQMWPQRKIIRLFFFSLAVVIVAAAVIVAAVVVVVAATVVAVVVSVSVVVVAIEAYCRCCCCCNCCCCCRSCRYCFCCCWGSLSLLLLLLSLLSQG